MIRGGAAPAGPTTRHHIDEELPRSTSNMMPGDIQSVREGVNAGHPPRLLTNREGPPCPLRIGSLAVPFPLAPELNDQ